VRHGRLDQADLGQLGGSELRAKIVAAPVGVDPAPRFGVVERRFQEISSPVYAI
jgi:hypothetical protein